MVLMKNLLFSVCFVIYFATHTNGLRCWTCQNMDIWTCIMKGRSEQCDENQESCQTVLRYHENSGLPQVAITGCKEISACLDNEEQNPSSTQCTPKKQGSVCRCCCNGPNCNRWLRNLRCVIKKRPKKFILFDAPGKLIPAKLERTCPEYPAAPENGEKYCKGGLSLRSFCKYTCNEGHTIMGGDMVICIQRGKDYVWNREAPKCVRNDICRKLPDQPRFGMMECDGNGAIGTVCGFACHFGYAMQGSSTSTCEKTGKFATWSHKTPVCLPNCDMASIPIPRNGARDCIGSGKIGTSCNFQCERGYRISGEWHTTCVITGEGGRWTNEAPECLAICKDQLIAPRKGFMTCSGRREAGSTCSFSCEENHRIVGEAESVCIEIANGAMWSADAPVCEPICAGDAPSPEFGEAECTGLKLGDECTFQCQPGFRIVGAESTTCVRFRGSAIWKYESPVCEPICVDMPESPRNGDVGCVGEGEVGTVCDYACGTGFRLYGQSAAECVKVDNTAATWTSEPPVCIPICHIMPEAPENGRMACEGTGDIGTACTFECDELYEIRGLDSMTCQEFEDRAKWSNEQPICKLIPRCDLTPKPENGNMKCNGTGQLGTRCFYTCDKWYKRMGGAASVCMRDGDTAYWTEPSVYCKEIEPECEPIGDFLHGHIVCDSDILRKGTNCHYECTEPGYELLSDHGSETKCVGEKRDLWWNIKKPCCVECKNIKKDIIIAMDSSGSIRTHDWENMKKFVQDIVRKFPVSKEAVQFCIYQFSDGARSDGLMYFGRYKKNQLIRQIGKMKRMGAGTKTGGALEYAQRRFRDRGNRKDVDDILWVVTDGKTDDMPQLEAVSTEMRQNNVQIMALAINPADDFVDQMTKMTGDREKVLLAENMDSLGKDLVSRITMKICQQSCPA